MRFALRRRGLRAGLPIGLEMSEDDVRATWQCASLLMCYPDDALLERLPLIADVARRLPPPCGEPLERLVTGLASADVDELRRDYVDTFDYTRRCAPYLTYVGYGDTRERGAALVRIKQAYRRHGAQLLDDDAELPDHLAVVLEFGATADLAAGAKLLLDHRAAVEVLRLALLEAGSRWADAVVAVCATLPPLAGDEMEAVARLIEDGPPREDVGLAPYAIDPRLNPHPDDDATWRQTQPRSGEGARVGGQGDVPVATIRPSASRQTHPRSGDIALPASSFVPGDASPPDLREGARP